MPRSGGAIRPAILSGLDHLLHEALHVGADLGRGDPFVFPRLPHMRLDRPAVRREVAAGIDADRAAEPLRGQRDLEIHAGLADDAVPALHTDVAILHMGAARGPLGRIGDQPTIDSMSRAPCSTRTISMTASPRL